MRQKSSEFYHVTDASMTLVSQPSAQGDPRQGQFQNAPVEEFGEDLRMTTIVLWDYTYEEVVRAIGVLGFMTYVMTYLLLCLNVVSSTQVRYFALNILAATLVLISLTVEFNLASALIQCFWIVIGALAVILRLRSRYGLGSGRPRQARL
jgi:hypothetical protein